MGATLVTKIALSGLWPGPPCVYATDYPHPATMCSVEVHLPLAASKRHTDDAMASVRHPWPPAPRLAVVLAAMADSCQCSICRFAADRIYEKMGIVFPL